jgi:hypothetical protein
LKLLCGHLEKLQRQIGEKQNEKPTFFDEGVETLSRTFDLGIGLGGKYVLKEPQEEEEQSCHQNCLLC